MEGLTVGTVIVKTNGTAEFNVTMTNEYINSLGPLPPDWMMKQVGLALDEVFSTSALDGWKQVGPAVIGRTWRNMEIDVVMSLVKITVVRDTAPMPDEDQDGIDPPRAYMAELWDSSKEEWTIWSLDSDFVEMLEVMIDLRSGQLREPYTKCRITFDKETWLP